jgi:hypothetical protein
MRFLESAIVVLALLGCNVSAVNAQTTAKSVNTDLDSMLNAYQGIVLAQVEICWYSFHFQCLSKN